MSAPPSGKTVETPGAGNLTAQDIWGADEANELDSQIAGLDVGQINNRAKILESNIRILKSDAQKLTHEHKQAQERIKENNEKIKMNKQLPYLSPMSLKCSMWKPKMRRTKVAMWMCPTRAASVW